MTRLSVVCCSLFFISLAVWGSPLSAHFRVYLDGDEIGVHRFLFEPLGDETSHYRVVSDATYEVKIFFIPIYQYQHRSVENWRGGCLLEMRSITDDNGEDYFVSGERTSDDELRIRINGKTGIAEKRCVRTFAYWNPQLLDGDKLLNSQTGKLENVELEKLGETVLPWDEARRGDTLVLVTSTGSIRLWYGEDSRWLGLRSTLANGRVLEYRNVDEVEVAAQPALETDLFREWSL